MSKLHTKRLHLEKHYKNRGYERSLGKIITKMELREMGQNVSTQDKNGQNLPFGIS